MVEMVVERAFLGKTDRRTALAMPFTSLSLPNALELSLSAEQESSPLSLKEFSGMVRWALETRDSDFIETLLDRPFSWGKYQAEPGTARKFFDVAFTRFKPKVFRYKTEGAGALLAVEDLSVPGLVPDSSRISIVRIQDLGGASVISSVEEMTATDWNAFRDTINDWEAPPMSDGTFVRHFWLRQGENRPHPDAKIHTEPGFAFLFVPGMTSSVVSGGSGMEATRLFLPFQSKLGKPFSPSGNIQMSWNGVRFDLLSGLSHAETQYCDNTLSHPKIRESMLYGVVTEFFSIHPNKKLTICTHSEGCHPVFLFMMRLRDEIARNPDFPIKPKNINIIFTHAPALGVNHTVFELLSNFDKNIPDDCKGPFGTPALGVLNSETGKYMTELWERKFEWARELEDLNLWWRNMGSRVCSIGSWQDGAFSSLYKGMYQFFVDLNLWADPRAREQLLTQKVPGASPAEMQYLGTDGFGHMGAWSTEQGTNWIKAQAKKGWGI